MVDDRQQKPAIVVSLNPIYWHAGPNHASDLTQPPGKLGNCRLSRKVELRRLYELVAELKHIHTSLISLLEDASDSCSLELRVPVTMVMKADDPLGPQDKVQWEEQLDWKAFAQTLRVHTIEHRSQIERTLRELSDSGVPEEPRV